VLGDLLLDGTNNSRQPRFASTKKMQRKAVMLEKGDSKLSSVSSEPESRSNMNERAMEGSCVAVGGTFC
jgi:hypothetical protein